MADISTKLQCVLVTPEKSIVDQEADSLVIPLFDGEMGILPKRAPLVSKLGFGCLKIRNGISDRYYFIEGGTVQIANNIVTLLTPRATEVASLDINNAKATLESSLEGKNALEKAKIKNRARAIILAGAKVSKK